MCDWEAEEGWVFDTFLEGLEKSGKTVLIYELFIGHFLEIVCREEQINQPRSQGSLLLVPLSRSGGRVGENPGNEVAN